jgi:hypothetical protein
MQRRSSCRAGASLFQPKHRAPLDRYRASCEGSRRSIGYAGPPNRPLRVGSTLAGADLVPGGTSLLGRRRPRRVGSTSAGVALVPGVASLLRGRNSTISTGWGPGGVRRTSLLRFWMRRRGEGEGGAWMRAPRGGGGLLAEAAAAGATSACGRVWRRAHACAVLGGELGAGQSELGERPGVGEGEVGAGAAAGEKGRAAPGRSRGGRRVEGEGPGRAAAMRAGWMRHGAAVAVFYFLSRCLIFFIWVMPLVPIPKSDICPSTDQNELLA